MLVHTVWWWASITCSRKKAVSSTSLWKGLPSILAGMVTLAKGKATANRTTSLQPQYWKEICLIAVINTLILCRNDIAILRLAVPVYDNGHVAIGNLPAPYETLPNGFMCYITGWGIMDCMRTPFCTMHCSAHSFAHKISAFPLHSLFSQTHQGQSLISCRWLPSLWWSTLSALSLTGGAASLLKAWCALEVMESFLAAR